MSHNASLSTEPTCSSQLTHPESFHPVYNTRISGVSRAFDECSLHLHYLLPPLVFVDPYELGNRRDSYSFKYAGTSNLELPVFALDAAQSNDSKSNSNLLIRIVPRTTSSSGQIDVEVPLHVRYGSTRTASSPFERTELAWPDAFFSCSTPPFPGAAEDTLPNLPGDFVDEALSSSSIFRIAFNNDTQRGATPIEVIRTPVGNAEEVARVELGTAVVILVSFFYLARAILRTVRRISHGREKYD
ncbi:PIG-X [Mycena rebaudengoi]|nr:PIG-X [Mycena rebaudengoi]